MTDDIFVITEPALGDSAYELVGKAKELGRVVAVLTGPGDPSDLAADRIIRLTGLPDAYVPDAVLSACHALVTQHDPKLVLLANSTVGMDLGAALAARWGRPIAAYVTAIDADGAITSQLYGGKLYAEATFDGGQGVCTVVSGSFAAAAGRGSGPAPEEVEAAASPGAVSFLSAIEPQGGDVDITATDILVSIGRGIGSQDNVELADELAQAIGAAVSASRPVTDQGWLPKTRQVGKSGLTVKPRAYLAFGISGAPEHLEGMRDAELIIACNTDEKAPIFDVAHYGTTVDLFDLLPALTEVVGG